MRKRTCRRCERSCPAGNDRQLHRGRRMLRDFEYGAVFGRQGADVAAEKATFYQMEKDYAKQAFESSGCRWRVIVAHAGLIQDDPTATAFLESMCDELNVDLYFNGHIHNYYRGLRARRRCRRNRRRDDVYHHEPHGTEVRRFCRRRHRRSAPVPNRRFRRQTPVFYTSGCRRQRPDRYAYQLSEEGDLSKAATFSSYSVTTPLR